MLKSIKLQDNIKLFYISTFFRAGNFWVPVWIALYNQILTKEQIGYFWAINFIVVGLLEIPTGIIADIIGRKNACAIGAFIMTIAFFVIAFYPTVNGILIYSLLSGLGEAFITGTRSVLLYDTMKQLGREEEYTKVQTYGLVIFEGLMAIFTIFGGWVYSLGYLKLPFILRAIFWAASVPLFMLMIEPKFNSTKQTFKNFNKIFKKAIKDLTKNKKIIDLSLLYIFAYGISTAVVRFLMQPILLDIGYTDSFDRALISAGLKLWIAIIAYLIARKYKNTLPNFYILIIPLIMILVYLPLKFLPSTFILLFLFPLAIPGNSRDVFLSPFVKKELLPDYRATSMSILNSLGTILFGIVNFMYGYSTNSLDYTFILGLISIIFLMPLSLYIFSKYKV